MDLILDPPRGVGSIEIGMPLDQAEQALREIDGYAPPEQGSATAPGFANYVSEMSIAVDPDLNGQVRSIEIYRPTHDVSVYFRGISVFEEAADDVIRLLSDLVNLDVEDGGLRAVAPDLLLALWRDTLPEGPNDDYGRCFESVLLAAPGYYD